MVFPSVFGIIIFALEQVLFDQANTASTACATRYILP